MTDAFEEREHAAEAVFAREQELRFLALARRDKLFARWVAEQMNLHGAAGRAVSDRLLRVEGFPNHDQMLLALAVAEFQSVEGAPDAAAAANALRRHGETALAELRRGDAAPIDPDAP